MDKFQNLALFVGRSGSPQADAEKQDQAEAVKYPYPFYRNSAEHNRVDNAFSCWLLPKKPGCPAIANPPARHVIKNQKFLSNASGF